MKEATRTLNILMNDFYDHWEKENTSEMFLQLSGNLNTNETKLNIIKNNERVRIIEDLINNEENYDQLTENWNNIDLKILDSLIDSFEINISSFINKIKNDKQINNEIKEFFK